MLAVCCWDIVNKIPALEAEGTTSGNKADVGLPLL